MRNALIFDIETVADVRPDNRAASTVLQPGVSALAGWVWVRLQAAVLRHGRYRRGQQGGEFYALLQDRG